MVDNSSIVTRKASSNENVEYTEPVILSENSKTKVTLNGWYIHHSDHIEFKAKITTYQKPELGWIEIEQKSISLNGEATSKLASELQKLSSIANEIMPGDYLTIRLSDGTANLDRLDPDKVVSSLLDVMSQENISKHLNGRELGPELAKALRYSVRLTEMKTAMLELRRLLESNITQERYYQEWCEKYPWAFGNQFVINDEIRSIGIHDQVDILVPRIMAGFRDIIELKRPDMDVLSYDNTHRDYFFTRDASMAIGQCHRYLDKFSEAARHGLDDAAHIVAYHPEATIVMGRLIGWEDEKIKALHGLNSRLSGIRIITYDHLLAQGESLVDYLSQDNETTKEDDIPF
ncbi:Shedu anti-phage system protein SduA domain-containing protein [Paraeggerthella hongkongensis]|uniref:DUF4263 domain-containing protein n=1 Tax=Paraeggerthella hongkongensis TaxID=230658 RepID=A0A3N0BIZ5_9ACTN|nr:Shedu anti-phage system protein SduA domain-containing protein [Paraeggerthella hongkongensis]RNL48086.1 DUF4263 domain-containing protein [Paraeggerthella hongkongensis]